MLAPEPVVSGTGAYRIGSKRYSKKTHQLKSNQEKESKPWYYQLAQDFGPTLGKMALAAVTGFGDYKVQSNALLAQATEGENGSELPMMMNSKVSNVIQHREFIQNIVGYTGSFQITTFDINPGLNETFPWLYPIANCFTCYRILGMIFEFKSLASSYTANTYLGYVAMGTQYNSLDLPFVDKQSLENSEYANSTKPSKDLIHPIECAPQQVVLNEQYIRGGSVPAGQDKRFYDLGKLSVATGGQTSAGILGELWCTYEIEFYQPKLAISSGILVNTDFWTNSFVAPATPLGLTHQQGTGGTMPGSSIVTGTGYLFPPITAGRYMVEIIWTGNANVAVATYPALITTYCTLIPFFKDSSAAKVSVFYAPPTGAVVMPTMSMRFVVEIALGEQAGFSLDGTGIYPLGTLYNCQIFVTQIPSSLVTLTGCFEHNMKHQRGFINTKEHREFIYNEQERAMNQEMEISKKHLAIHSKRYIEGFEEEEDSDTEENQELINLKKETEELKKSIAVMTSSLEYLKYRVSNPGSDIIKNSI
jgi:hypothetical protein